MKNTPLLMTGAQGPTADLRTHPTPHLVARVLQVSHWIGTAVTYALAIIVGIVGAAVASHFTPS